MYAVIFVSKRAEASSAPGEDDGYEETAERMFEMCAEQPGFLGFESARSPGGSGITVCYWESEEAIAAWRANAEHLVAQERGRADWYVRYRIQVCKVERDSEWSRS
jgi:heme-degrading monooxygenase HmoA